jgi:NADH:ubiquinone oxidoreductase subunit F (NADH-binding)/(2Fe-2S) ferredoxin
MATCGLATGAKKVYDTIQHLLEGNGSDAILTKSGCLGFCQKEPLVDIYEPGMPRLTYGEMTPESTRELLENIIGGRISKDHLLCKFEKEVLLLEDQIREYDLTKMDGNLEEILLYEELPFFSKQKKFVLRNCGFINPDSLDEYIARGGYRALFKALNEFSAEEVIEEIKRSGLRGRGGAGFPTGRKWNICRMAQETPKYIICNADEGDPGAYMDRSVLEGDPHSVLEGMLIGAYGIGASAGYIYVRTEYPLAIERLMHAIKEAQEHGLLGKNIFNSDFDFTIEIVQGSGAFVCGEETSLIASIEGRSAEPTQRPPFPAESGLWEKPTNINNVETWANVPVIIARGGTWFSQFGTQKSTGTKVFSLVGKVTNTGLVEVPMGISLKEIVYDIGGGILEGKKLKAVQTGGPSGGCIPAKLMDLPVDYESLAEARSIMGSGGMIVMDESTCVVDIAKFFLQFTNDESCGKCSICREGSQALLEVLTDITNGNAEEGDVQFLTDLCLAIKDASLCGLGQTLPNPVLSTLEHFREEYEAHIKAQKCPAVVCRNLIHYTIDVQKCNGCLLCTKNCPLNAITGEKKKPQTITQSQCSKCGVCFDICNFGAIDKGYSGVKV